MGADGKLGQQDVSLSIWQIMECYGMNNQANILQTNQQHLSFHNAAQCIGV